MRIKDAVYVYRLVGGERLSWHGRYHAHGASEYEFHYFVEGQGAFLSNRARFPIEGGNLFLTRPREFHSILPQAVSRPLTYYAALFEPEEGSREDELAITLLERALLGTQRCLPLEGRDRFLFEELLRLSHLPDEGGRRAASYQLLSLIHRWFGHHEATGRSGTGRNPHVEKALSLMARDLRKKLGTADLAEHLGISGEHFIRIFRAELGMSPFQYFTRLKIEAASGLLASTELSVSEISEHFDFENQFHFSKVFKKCTGLPPLAYRAMYSQKTAQGQS